MRKYLESTNHLRMPISHSVCLRLSVAARPYSSAPYYTRVPKPRFVRAVESEDTRSSSGSIRPGTIVRPSVAGLRKQGWMAQKLKGFKIMGLEPSPELVAISMVYFVQGILGLSRLALSFFFKDSLGLDPAEVALITGLAGIPWMVKPLYGFISDSIPLWGYHRRSYLVLAGLTGFTAWLCLCFLVDSAFEASAAMLAASLSTAASDVLVDSLVVERARDAPQAVAGSLQSLCWGSAAIGGIVSAYWSGYLVETIGTRSVFGITACFPLVVSCAALLINEHRIDDRDTIGSPPANMVATRTSGSSSDTQYRLPTQGSNGSSVYHRALPGNPAARATDASLWDSEKGPLLGSVPPDNQSGGGANGNGSRGGSVADFGVMHPVVAVSRGENGNHLTVWKQISIRARVLWSAISRKDILLPTLFVFAWQATPSADSAMFYFQTNELGFQPEFLGRVRLISSLASLSGVLLYNTTLKKVPLRTFLWWAMVLGVALGSTQLVLVSRLNVTLGLSDQLFVLGDAALLTALGQCSFMPILVLAARLCPQGVEATLFATLMSVLNAGSFVGSGLGAGLTKFLGVTSTDFNHLFTLVLLCNVGQLLPAPLLNFLPESLDKPGADEEEATASDRRTSPTAFPEGKRCDDEDRDVKHAPVVDIELQAGPNAHSRSRD